MSSPTGSSQWFANPGANFYNDVNVTSLRLAGNANLAINNADGGTSNKVATFSFWFKRTELTVLQHLIHSVNDSGGASFGITLDADDSISVTQYNGTSPFNSGQYDFGVTTDPVKLRDTSAWYHLVVDIDTTEAAEGNRIKIYVNGVAQTVVATNDGSGSQDFADENQTLAIFQDGTIKLGSLVTDGQFAHCYLAECNGVDGLSLGPTAFGESNNGVWIPIVPAVSEYGNHGFRLRFTSTTHDAPASIGSAETDNIGADSSGKNNHFTAIDAIAASDCAMPDSPENNFCTMNDLYRFAYSGGDTLTKGNLLSTHGSSGVTNNVFTTHAISNSWGLNWYAEVRINAYTNGSIWVGVVREVGKAAGGLYTAGVRSNGYAYKTDGNKTTTDNNGASYGDSYAAGDIIGIFLDTENGTVFFSKNGTVQNSGTVAFSSIAAENGYFLMGVDADPGNNVTWNFGQDSSFAGTETATSNADANDLGTFHTAPPSGFLAVCTANFPDPVIGPNSDTKATDHFDTVIRTGTGSEATVALDFQPDFLWTKTRSHAVNHNIASSSLTYNYSFLQPNEDTPENTGASAYYMTPTSTGYTVGTGDNINQNNYTFVDWLWRANGGTATATISESGDNPAAVVQANPTAGFSIVAYTGTQAVGTIAHGLGAVPKLMIFKNRAVDGNGWIVYHETTDQTDFLFLNNTNATADNANRFNDTAPTSSVFTLGADANINDDGVACIGFIFAEVEGYSSIGYYKGNNNVNGPLILTGFRPAWIISKKTSGTGNWEMFDTVRDTSNTTGKYLLANSSDAEGDTGTNTAGHVFDIVSNGFKIRNTNADRNANNAIYIYMAFAENPFKYANAR